MKTVDEQIEDMLDAILKNEDRRYRPGVTDPNSTGWTVDNPGDRGEATALGVSLRYMRGIGLDLNGDGEVDKRDVALVTPAIARNLFRVDFLETPRIDELPAELHPQMFDTAVLSGAHRAIELLQRAINGLGERPMLEEDGRFGPSTRRAAERCIARVGWQTLNNWLVNERLAFFDRIVRRDPTQTININGWRKRAEGFRV